MVSIMNSEKNFKNFLPTKNWRKFSGQYDMLNSSTSGTGRHAEQCPHAVSVLVHSRCSIVYWPPALPPVISGILLKITGPPPLTPGPEVQLCWLLTLEPSAQCTIFPSTFSPERKVFNLSIKNYWIIFLQMTHKWLGVTSFLNIINIIY